MPYDSLKNLLKMFPYFFDKRSVSNFYKVQSVSNEQFKNVYQSVFEICEGFHLNKRCLIWKEQESPKRYEIHFVANFPNLKKVSCFKNDAVVYTKLYTLEEHEDTFNYTYVFSSGNDDEEPVYTPDCIPDDLFKIVVETYDEIIISKGFPENDVSMDDIYDHDYTLDRIGELNGISRKNYNYDNVTPMLYPFTEPPFNNKLTEDDYHYMKRILNYNLKLHTLPITYLPVLELWKLYGIDSEMVNRERFLLKFFDLEKHPNFIDESAEGDKWFSGTLDEVTGEIREWVPEVWEHQDKFCNYTPEYGVFFIVTANTLHPGEDEDVVLKFYFLNSRGELLTDDYYVDVLVNDRKLLSDSPLKTFTVPSSSLDPVTNTVVVIGKNSIREVISTKTLDIQVRGCNDANFYVSPSGSDSNTGKSKLKPFKTVQKAVSMVEENKNFIVILEGEFTFNSPITISEDIIILGCPTSGNIVRFSNNGGEFFRIAQNKELCIRNIYLNSVYTMNDTFINNNGISRNITVISEDEED